VQGHYQDKGSSLGLLFWHWWSWRRWHITPGSRVEFYRRFGRITALLLPEIDSKFLGTVVALLKDYTTSHIRRRQAVG